MGARRLRTNTTFRVIALFPRAGTLLTVAFAAAVAIRGFLPVVTILATTNLARVMTEVVEVEGAAMGLVLPAIVLVAALYLLQQLMGPVEYWVSGSLGERLSAYWRERVMKAALDPSGVAHLENASSADSIWLASGIEQRSMAPARLVGAVADLSAWRIQGIASALLLLAYRWWMPIALAVAWLPLWYIVVARTRIQMTNAESGSPELRRAGYYRDTAMTASAAKEIRLFGLQQWIVERFVDHRAMGVVDIWQEKGFARWAFVPCLLAPAGVSAAILAIAIRATLSGAMGIPDITLITLAVIGAQRIGKAMAWWTRSFLGAGAIAGVMDLDAVSQVPQATLRGEGVLSRPAE